MAPGPAQPANMRVTRQRAARERHPHLPIETTSPLGEDARIAEIILSRMDDQPARDRQSS